MIEDKRKAVITFTIDEIYEIKRIILDDDIKEAMTFLKKLDKRIDETLNPK